MSTIRLRADREGRVTTKRMHSAFIPLTRFPSRYLIPLVPSHVQQWDDRADLDARGPPDEAAVTVS